MSNASEPLTWGRRLAGLGLITALGFSLVACGGDDDDEDATSAGDGTEQQSDSGDGAGSDPYGEAGGGGDSGGGSGGSGTLEITGLQYRDVSAAAGSTLEVVDSSGAAHTFTADDGAFDEEVPANGSVSVAVPSEPGEYPFHCEIHSSMQATLTVS
ncbi:MAG TPA: cupredoxin domain-containing protein [Acidimicrobiales bacterium]